MLKANAEAEVRDQEYLAWQAAMAWAAKQEAERLEQEAASAAAVATAALDQMWGEEDKSLKAFVQAKQAEARRLEEAVEQEARLRGVVEAREGAASTQDALGSDRGDGSTDASDTSWLSEMLLTVAGAIGQMLSNGAKALGGGGQSNKGRIEVVGTPVPPGVQGPNGVPVPLPTAPILPTPTPSAQEIRARIRVIQARIAAADAELQIYLSRTEQESFTDWPIEYIMGQAIPYHDGILAEKYGTTVSELVAPPYPRDNPLTDDDLFSDVWPMIIGNRSAPENTRLLELLNLDLEHWANYEPAYLAELRYTYPEEYESARSAPPDEVAGSIVRSAAGGRAGEIRLLTDLLYELARKMRGTNVE